jgi:hypothetical protein
MIECDECGAKVKVDILRGTIDPHHIWIMTSDGPRETGAWCVMSGLVYMEQPKAASVAGLLGEVIDNRVWVTDKGQPRTVDGHLIRKKVWEIASSAGWIRMHGSSPVVTALGKSWVKQ